MQGKGFEHEFTGITSPGWHYNLENHINNVFELFLLVKLILKILISCSASNSSYDILYIDLYAIYPIFTTKSGLILYKMSFILI